MTCAPSGASEGSSTVGTTPSENGRLAGIARRASSNAVSRYSTQCASSIPPDRSVKSGAPENRGSFDSAQLILTTPLRVFQCSMSFTNSSGSSLRSNWRRNVSFGWHAVTTTGAMSSSPPSSATPDTRPCRTRTRSTGAFVRTSAPKDRALRSRASATAPMPPSGTPHPPRVPPPTFPIEWWAITYPVPGSYGPAHVPMRPVDGPHRLDLVGLEEPVHDVRHRHRQEPGDLADRPDVQPAEPPG